MIRNEHAMELVGTQQVQVQARRWVDQQAGKIGYALLWLLGIPLPILIIIYLIRGH